MAQWGKVLAAKTKDLPSLKPDSPGSTWCKDTLSLFCLCLSLTQKTNSNKKIKLKLDRGCPLTSMHT